jgi:hypothetical protein
MKSHTSLLKIPVAPLLFAFLSGCGGEGFPRHQISGKVTYQGQPVEYGAIVFEPEASIGKIAPTGQARIENGAFKTDSTESPTTGAYKVRVTGFDKSKMKANPAPGEIIDTPELFPEHVLQVEIPPPGGRLDIEVPSASSPSANP